MRARTNQVTRGPLLAMLAMPALVTIAIAIAPAVAAAPALEVGGALPKTGTLSLAELEAMGPIKAAWTGHDGKHDVYGVPLERVLTHFGFQAGPMGKDVPKEQKRKGWRQAVVAQAADGFEAVLSCAEIFESMGTTRALLIWKIDGKPLPGDRGPLRLVVLTDKEPSRSIYGLRKLHVVDVRAP